MKKVLVIFMALALVFAFAACGGEETPAPAPAESPAEGPAEAPAEASAYTPHEIVVSHVYAEDHNCNTACIMFKEYLEEETDGVWTVNLQPNSALGGDDEALELCAAGTVQLMVPSVASMETYSGAWSVLSLPYIYSSVEGAYQAMDGALGDYIKSTLDGTDFICVGFNSNGTRNMSNNVHPINGIDDIKGLKMRVMNSATYVSWMNALGANATPMGFNEVFTALQQGTVDGQENAAAISYTSAFNEVQKYFSLTEHIYDMNAIICNRDFVEGLNEAELEIFNYAVKTYLEEWQRQTEIDEDSTFIAKWEEGGSAINSVTDEAKAEFREALAGIYAESQAQYPEVWELLEPYRDL